MHPSVSVVAHGNTSGDSAGEGGGVSHHNPCESCCDLHLWWHCIESDIVHTIVEYMHKRIMKL